MYYSLPLLGEAWCSLSSKFDASVGGGEARSTLNIKFDASEA